MSMYNIHMHAHKHTHVYAHTHIQTHLFNLIKMNLPQFQGFARIVKCTIVYKHDSLTKHINKK